MTRYDREKLYVEVWKEPVSAVAKRYGVSGTALAKACRRLNVPLPPRGYWAKLRAGVSVSIPALPEYVPVRSDAVPPEAKENPRAVKKEQKGTKKKLQRIKKEHARPQSLDPTQRRIHAFLRGHMLEKEDLIHHFRYLIACLEKEDYAGYSDEFKRRRTEFLQDCINRIKSAHLPAILAPWTSYECNESIFGFSIGISETEKMTVENDENVSEEGKELCSVMELPYHEISISEYASIHQISEATVLEWLNSGKLSGASFEDDEWKIPELHRIPEDDEFTVYLEFNQDEPVYIPEYPLLSSCTELWIKPEGRGYLVTYCIDKREPIGQLQISAKEKDALMGELLKQGVSRDPFAYEIPYYSAKKHFEIDMSKWRDIPPCDW